MIFFFLLLAKLPVSLQERAACACRRVDGRGLSAEALLATSEPTILEHLIRSEATNRSRQWSRTALLREYGELLFSLAASAHALDASGAAYYVRRLAAAGLLGGVAEVSLAQILDLDQPGDLFVPLLHPRARLAVDEYLAGITWPPQLSNILQSLTTRGSRAVTLGARGQWYHVHIHEMTLFIQARGRKGFALAPAGALARAAAGGRGLPANAAGAVGRGEVCGRFGVPLDTMHDWLDGSQVGAAERAGAARNFSRRALLCELREGEALLLPGRSYWTGWWHGVCNLEAWNVGLSFIATGMDLWKGIGQ